MILNYSNCKLIFFYKDAFIGLKTRLNCFALFDNRIIEGNVYSFKRFCVVDIGFKYLTTIKIIKNSEKISLRLIKLENIFNKLYIDYYKFKDELLSKLNWSLIKKAFVHKCFIKGKVLNPVSNGLSIGVWGFVGFISQKDRLVNRCNIRSIFFIININYLRNTFVLSQKKMLKTISRILNKLSFHIAYVPRNKLI